LPLAYRGTISTTIVHAFWVRVMLTAAIVPGQRHLGDFMNCGEESDYRQQETDGQDAITRAGEGGRVDADRLVLDGIMCTHREMMR
jgi:hypothetical protein